MPQTKKERLIFAFLTVLVTVHAYVFYSLYVVNGAMLLNITGASSVIAAINSQNGVSALGTHLPIWAIILIEFCFAYTLEIFIGSPLSFKLACKNFNMKKTNPVIFETVIISATVVIMCPLMSFIAAFIYYPYSAGFNFFTFLANFLKLVCLNFPFAFFSQIFFIQPLIRTIFKTIFRRTA